jgi:hypothetical protein
MTRTHPIFDFKQVNEKKGKVGGDGESSSSSKKGRRSGLAGQAGSPDFPQQNLTSTTARLDYDKIARIDHPYLPIRRANFNSEIPPYKVVRSGPVETFKTNGSSARDPNVYYTPSSSGVVRLDSSKLRQILHTDGPPETGECDQTPSTSAGPSGSSSNHSHIPRKLNETEGDMARKTKRPAGKKKGKVAPVQDEPKGPLFEKCKNRIPAHRLVSGRREEGCWGRFWGRMRSGWKKMKAGGKWVREAYARMMVKKGEWDRWNPDKEHPVAKFIDETKLAGLKETIKPNRGILYR